MALTSAVTFSDNEQLKSLRLLDQYRQWHSLDEKRYCLVCGKLITGRQIQLDGGNHGNGPLRLNCPTVGCNSIPMDWVLPTDEILARVEKLVEDVRKASALEPTAVTIGNGTAVSLHKPHNDLMSRLFKFALPFKRNA